MSAANPCIGDDDAIHGGLSNGDERGATRGRCNVRVDRGRNRNRQADADRDAMGHRSVLRSASASAASQSKLGAKAKR